MTGVVYIILQPPSNNSYMNKNEIIEISNSGIEIGSHTISHPDLTKLSANRLKNEVFESKATLEQALSKQVLSFCYPSGKKNDEVIKAVETAGYLFGVTTESGVANTAEPLKLNRYRIKDHSTLSFLKTK